MDVLCLPVEQSNNDVDANASIFSKFSIDKNKIEEIFELNYTKVMKHYKKKSPTVDRRDFLQKNNFSIAYIFESIVSSKVIKIYI